MNKTKSQLYELISDLMDRDAFEAEISSRFQDYEGLLSEDAISYLIVDELKRNEIESADISKLKAGESVTIEVEVEGIKDPREFTRKNGSTGQVVNISIANETGRCRLTLWDSDVEAVKSSIIKIGSRLKIVNGYVKISDFGPEINIGRWGRFFVK
jgi:replication factor A1